MRLIFKSLWCAHQATHTYLMHLGAEISEHGGALYFHSFGHVWSLPQLVGNEVGEADQRIAKRFVPMTSIKPPTFIDDS